MAEIGTWDWLRRLLREANLEDLFDVAKGRVTAGASQAEVHEALRSTPQYQTRFKAVFERERAGKTPITPAMVIEHERQLEALFSFYDWRLNPGESIQEIAAQQLGNDVSAREVESRLIAYRDLYDRIASDPMNADVVARVMQVGGSPMDVARALAEPGSTQQIEARLRAASIALEARRGGGMELRADEAMDLQARGVTADQARAGFGELARNREVTGALPGEEGAMTRERQIAAVAGDATAVQEIERRRDARKAAFGGGGGFATDKEGFGGLR
jgi:hypothetical protein